MSWVEQEIVAVWDRQRDVQGGGGREGRGVMRCVCGDERPCTQAERAKQIYRETDRQTDRQTRNQPHKPDIKTKTNQTDKKSGRQKQREKPSTHKQKINHTDRQSYDYDALAVNHARHAKPFSSDCSDKPLLPPNDRGHTNFRRA